MTVFVDTSALVAILDATDAEHERARATFSRLVDDRIDLMTHDYVVVETTAVVQRRLGLPAVRALVDRLLPAIDVRFIGPDGHVAAREALLAADRRSVSLVDWASFLVMRDAGLDTAFTFDGDFAAQGFRTIPS